MFKYSTTQMKILAWPYLIFCYRQFFQWDLQIKTIDRMVKNGFWDYFGCWNFSKYVNYPEKFEQNFTRTRQFFQWDLQIKTIDRMVKNGICGYLGCGNFFKVCKLFWEIWAELYPHKAMFSVRSANKNYR